VPQNLHGKYMSFRINFPPIALHLQLLARKPVADRLATLMADDILSATAKTWHRSAVWFIVGNHISAYTARNKGVHLMFWSG
jgi:hypothetical protein